MAEWEEEVQGEMEEEEEDVEVQSEGYESPGGPEEIQIGAASDQNGEARSSTSGQSTSDSSEGESSEEEGQGGEGDDLEHDLFGPRNEDYMRTTPHSRLPIPTLPDLPARNDDQRRNSRGGFRGAERPFSSQPFQSGYKPKDMLVADMKLGAVGHSDETLRISIPPFQEPQQICTYSRTPDGSVYINDERCLRKFRRRVLTNFEADLNEGFENFVDKREDLESSAFADLLRCIRTTNTAFKDIHFVTFRNNMNKILGTTYNRRDPWEMGVYKRSGTVYLNVRHLPEPPRTELQQRQCYWGYKYEEVATENPQRDLFEMSGDAEPAVVDANSEFCTVVRTKLGPHRIIMGAEIDCYDVGSDGKKRYTELKTCHELDSRTVERFERDKLLKFWIQSYLVGVPKIVCGFRDDNGRLLRSDMMLTQEIARRMKHRNYWEGKVCLAFADRVLCWLYGSVIDGGDYILRYLPNGNRLELWKDDSCPAVISEHIEQIAAT